MDPQFPRCEPCSGAQCCGLVTSRGVGPPGSQLVVARCVHLLAAVSHDGQPPEILPLPPGMQSSRAHDINNANDFCGYILGYSGCSTFPMRYRQAVGWEYLGGCATTTSATAINDSGDALLYYYMTTSGVHFVDEGYFALGALIDPSPGEWYVQAGGANGINTARQIVAAARQGQSGFIGAILMTPMDGGALFADGFESGGTDQWSSTVP